MGLGMMRMFCFTHVYMIPLWMIVVACTGERWRVLRFFYSFLFSFSPSVFHGWVCVFFLSFFGGHRLKCRAINYSFFHHRASNSYILLLSTLVLGLGFSIGVYFFDIFALCFFWGRGGEVVSVVSTISYCHYVLLPAPREHITIIFGGGKNSLQLFSNPEPTTAPPMNHFT